MLLIYGSLLAGLIPVIWINYLRKIDLFEQESLKAILTAFVLGCIFTFLVFPINSYIIEPTGFKLNGEGFNDLMYCILGIGLPEEIVKILPVLFIYFYKKEKLNEPLDLIIYGCSAALGFSFMENIIYVYRYGYDVIPGRAIISSPMHMFFTGICMYGFVLFKYHFKSKLNKLTLIFYIFLGVFAHAVFDYFLITIENGIGFLLSFFFYLLIISVFAGIINNCINQSSYFTYKKVVDSDKLTKWIGNAYIGLLVLYLVGCFFLGDETAIQDGLFGFNKVYGVSILLMSVRLTRFKLIQNKWEPLKLEFPFQLGGPSRISIRGEGFNETFINQYLEKQIRLFPFPTRINPKKLIFQAYIEEKIFTEEERAIYLVKVFNKGNDTDFTYFGLVSKTNGITEFNPKKPIAGLYSFKEGIVPDSFKFSFKSLEFYYWVEILP